MLIEQVNARFAAYLRERRQRGCTSFAFCGGRRSGKTFFVAQFLTTRAYGGDVVNVASMTQRQGRLGAYADFCAIIKDSPTLSEAFDCLLSPLEIRNRANGGLVLFNSYANSETAKGIPCDWLFINEANNFTKQQVADLRANVRAGWIIDYNPVARFWADDYFTPADVCHSTWRDNPFLTRAQLDYFDELRAAALAPEATAMDRWLYRTYYLGELSELTGAIFTPDNLRRAEVLPDGLYQFIVFCDPSDLRGADYFAAVLAATDGRAMYVVEAFSENVGTDETVAEVLRQWCNAYPVERVLVESNGSIGRRFYEYAANSGLPAVAWWSKGDKFERITANYQDLTRRVVFRDTPTVRDFLQQAYTFARRCEHDDNIDAVNSAFNYYNWSRYLERE